MSAKFQAMAQPAKRTVFEHQLDFCGERSAAPGDQLEPAGSGAHDLHRVRECRVQGVLNTADPVELGRSPFDIDAPR
jgi:hypothetical protein